MAGEVANRSGGHILISCTADIGGYRLIEPGSQWRLHRYWFERSAMGDWHGEDFALVAKDHPYCCLDKFVAHNEALFTFLRGGGRICSGCSSMCCSTI
jgi:hypothetical protein